MEAQDRIYVSRPVCNQYGLVISEEKPVKYIRIDSLIEWAKAHKVNCIGDHYTDGRNDAMDLLIKMLDLL